MKVKIDVNFRNSKSRGKCIEEITVPNSVDKKDGIITDPYGSWTGVNVENKYEKPVQDVDDL